MPEVLQTVNSNNNIPTFQMCALVLKVRSIGATDPTFNSSHTDRRKRGRARSKQYGFL